MKRLALILSLCALVARAMTPSPWEQVQECKHNVFKLESLLEIYSCDHGGKYPDSLDALGIDVPRCPVAGSSRPYREGYRRIKNDFKLGCQGHYHAAAGVPPNTPQTPRTCTLGMEGFDPYLRVFP